MAKQNTENSIFQIKTTLRNTVIVFLLSIFTVSGDYEYIGCYIDNDDRALDDLMVGRSYTPQKCAEACSRYRFFSIQDNDECFCESSYEDATKYDEDTYGCSNGKGGGWRYALYVKGDSDSETYLGCYHDISPFSAKGSTRALDDNYKGSGYNVNRCRKACGNYKYFAMQDYNKCFCDNQYRDATRYGSSDGCSSHRGGDWDNALYRRSVRTGYIGCFVDHSDRALDDFMVGRSYTPEECENACSGYPFYSIQDNDQCFCEHSFEDAIRYGEDPDGCSNGKGGGWRNALYVHRIFSCEETCNFNDYRLSKDIHPCKYKNKLNSGDVGIKLDFVSLLTQDIAPILSTAMSWASMTYGIWSENDNDDARLEWEQLMDCVDDKIDDNNLKVLSADLADKIDDYLDYTLAAQRNLDSISTDIKDRIQGVFLDLDDIINRFVSLIDTNDKKQKALEGFALLVEHYQLVAATHLSLEKESYVTDLDDYKENIIDKLFNWIDTYYKYIMYEYPRVSLTSSSGCYSEWGSQYGFWKIQLKRASDSTTVTKCATLGSEYVKNGGTIVGWACGDCSNREQTINRWNYDYDIFMDSFRYKYYDMIYNIKESL